MRYEIKQRPNFSMARVEFEQAGEQLRVESAAMVAKDTAVEMKTEMAGGFMAAAKRKMLGGESLFQSTFTAAQPGDSIWIAPAAEGDMLVQEMSGNDVIFMSSGNYIASATSVQLDTEWKGGKGFFSGTSMFMLRATGQGPLFMGSYGGIHTVDVQGGYIVDNNHIVAFTGGLDYRLNKVGGIRSLIAGGEGIVCEFRGNGRLWISTRSSGALANFLHPYRRVAVNND